MPDFYARKPLKKGAVRDVKINFGTTAGRLGTTVSSVAWSTTDTSTVSLGAESLTSGIATCRVTASEEGKALIKSVATMSNGEIEPATFCMEVIDNTICDY